jgi:ferredoxin
MTLRPVIDPYACAAHGDCVDELPEAFALDGDVVTVIGTGPDDGLLAAARACPSTAITLHDESGAQTYP